MSEYQYYEWEEAESFLPSFLKFHYQHKLLIKTKNKH